MFVGVARLTLQIPESGSLKSKRQVLRRVMDRVKARFNVAMAEVEDQDLWQKATLALSVVGNERRHVDEQLEKVIHFIEEMYVAPLMSRETEILAFGDQLFAGGPSQASSLGAKSARQVLDEEDEALSPEEAAAESEAAIARFLRGERASLAEAEGLGDWERRHDGDNDGGPGTGRPSPSGGGRMTLDEARARARALRNPRDWEKK
ncbi:DUF503 domain-containing protein [Myxococcus faecalis]|jgi:hypothetical protein|uniref:DUF503 domain-containing protein n=1 Tax=Myxococcus TaxID=32 RepID=UPI0011434C39|nr:MULTISPECIES: DUF503 domain-containing protein [Myxococcus]MBZ4400434.1 DUF503 domain-containing protein [Myxococcus sp. AS-1-15]MBZ4410870.1 DUF503 domain-containing protein [Myxococcus sp. XM-1-1-1]MCK8501178.1 DUF503 domain-containing protein [Myxococcus fulvus]BDT32805.1 DUF503 domain-containing protein [Myxococcus sp. MH1]